MKLSKYIFAAFALIATASVGFTSCSDQPDKYEVTAGVPTVKYIRLLSSEIVGNNDSEDKHYTNGELVESAGPGNTICLVGDNLTSVVEIFFNGLPAVLNNSYITANTLIVDVPKDIPTEVNNLMTLRTQDGSEVNVPFSVVIPKPFISRMNCEYAARGSEETITGRYFIDDPGTPLTVTFTAEGGGEVEAKINSISPDFTKLNIVIPENAAEGPITVTSVYGATESNFYYQDHRGILFDFDNPNSVTGIVLDNHGWNGHSSKDDDGTGISGRYFQFGDGSAKVAPEPDAGWPDEKYFSFVYWPGDSWDGLETYATTPRLYDIVNFTDWTQMAMKFEMCIPKEYEWKAGAMQIVFAGIDRTSGAGGGVDIYGNVVHASDNAYLQDNACPRALYRPWTTTGSYHTDGNWVTVTIPLASDFIYNWQGVRATQALEKESFASLWISVFSGGIEGSECTPIIKLDNLRVVPLK